MDSSELFVGFLLLEEVLMSEDRDLWVAILAPNNGLVLVVKAKNADREYRLEAFIIIDKFIYEH